MEIETIREFFGWCTAINFTLLVLAFIKVVGFRDFVTKIRAKMFGIDDESVRRVHFQLIVIYMVIIVAFNLTPYIALSMML